MKRLFMTYLALMLFSSNAYAYLDGGTASMIIQLLVGGVAVAASFIKMYWDKIKSFFIFEKKNRDSDSDDADDA